MYGKLPGQLQDGYAVPLSVISLRETACFVPLEATSCDNQQASKSLRKSSKTSNLASSDHPWPFRDIVQAYAFHVQTEQQTGITSIQHSVISVLPEKGL